MDNGGLIAQSHLRHKGAFTLVARTGRKEGEGVLRVVFPRRNGGEVEPYPFFYSVDSISFRAESLASISQDSGCLAYNIFFVRKR